MMVFIGVVALFAVLAVAQISYPLWRHPSTDVIADLLPWYQQQQQQLTEQWSQHQISDRLYQQNTLALQRELLNSQSAPVELVPPLFAKAWVSVVSVTLVCLSLVFYWQQGTVQWLKPSTKESSQQLLQQMGGIQSVMAALQQRLQQHPNDAYGWYLLGRLYVNNNQMPSAIEALTRANRLQPQQSSIELSLAEALYLSHHSIQQQHAKHLLNQLLQRDPNNPGALNLLALLAYQQHDYAKAIELWQKAWAQVPTNSETAQALQRAIKQAQTAMKSG